MNSSTTTPTPIGDLTTPVPAYARCCNTCQIEAFVVIAITAVVTCLLWRCSIVAPIKLVAVFLHELSHALATWITCGEVVGIEVNEDFGGTTLSRGGCRCFTLSAGYIGSVFWGSFFILMSFHWIATRVAAAVFILACIVTAIVINVKDAKLCCMTCCMGLALRFVVLLVALIPAGLWALEETVPMKVHPLRWCMLAIGTMCTLHAFYDCVDDLICPVSSSKGKSDADMLADEICGFAICWGLLFSLIALAAVVGGVYGVTVLSSDAISADGKCYRR